MAWLCGYNLGMVDGLTSGNIMELNTLDTWQTQARGTNDTEYQIYLSFADDGKGGDITNNGKPLKTYDEWLAS